MKNSFVNFYNLVKFPHTVFALPFAFTGFALGIIKYGGDFTIVLFFQILGAMVFARNAAMGFNRYIDRYIDASNPRTKGREIPSGLIAPERALWFTIINVALFILVSLSINELCFYLSFPALAVLLGYSYTKRFTWLCHYVLGLGLAMAPAGAFIAVTGTLTPAILTLLLAVLFWVSGFDIIYSLPDADYDAENNLNSIPQRFGIKRALTISSAGHLIVAPLIVLTGVFSGAGSLYYIGSVLFLILLVYQHVIVKPNDLSRVNAAFFTANGFASIIYAIFSISDMFV